ncbi:hypothetical protein ACFCZ1_22160 [Streptomyces sp. NPDC056224]|uniref:hypothetical protein n=1 Tax=Streptomyces sp. NPDC056224 TaxID=3345750 RepID=UPI0035E204C0
MPNTPDVAVLAPDDLGWRKVTINGKSEGKVRSPRQLQALLRHAGLEEIGRDIHWVGGDDTVWPDRAVQRRAVGTIVFLGFLFPACLLIRIGWADSRDALTFGGRLAGYTVLAAGLVVLIAAVATLDYWHKRKRRYSGAIVLAGVVIVFLGSFSLLLMQLDEHFNRWSTTAGIFLVWSVVAGIGLIRSRAWKGLRNPGRIAIGAIVPTLLASINLAYSQIYVPYATIPLIMSGAEFKEATLDRTTASMQVTVHLSVKNSGQIPVYVLGSIYWIQGGASNSITEGRPPKYKMIYDGEFVTPAGRVLNPGEEITQDAVVEIKKPEEANYEAIRAQTEVYVIRKDRMILPPKYEESRATVETLKKEGKLSPNEPAHTKYRNDSDISNSSEILNVTRGRQHIMVWRVSNAELPRIDVAISPPGDRIHFNPALPNFNQEIIDRYGLAKVRGSTAQTPFKELLEKAESIEKGTSQGQSGQ